MPLIPIVLHIFFGRVAFINWLQNHLIPCPFKYLTGIDCPGCGFQRAVLALIEGDFHKSFLFYPPAIPLLVFFAYGLADKYFKLDNSKNTIKKATFIVVGTIILASYTVKMFIFYEHYKASV